MTNTQRIIASLQRIEESRPATDKKYHRVRDDRKLDTVRRPDGSHKMGGWRGNPNSLAALEAHRRKGGFHPGGRRCHCGQPAVRGSDGCRFHGGKAVMNARKKADPLWKPKRKHVQRRELRRLMREGTIPRDLIQIDAFRSVMDAAFYRIPFEVKHGTREFAAEVARVEVAVGLALEFITAYLMLSEHGDHSPWQAVLGKAKRVGLIG